MIKGADFGDCLTKWTPEYLIEKLNDMPVKIHHSNEPILNFLKKNFTYKTIQFNELINKCISNDGNEYFYLRALGTDKRGREIANLKKHFKSIGDDIEIPSFINLAEESDESLKDDEVQDEHQLFSSVLRISSPNLVLWTHYDILDNILLQIHGTKSVTLFSPEDVPYLYLEGDKSKVHDIDASIEELKIEFPLFLKATRYQCELHSGDALFIPSLWFHNVKANDFSISVNFFWKDKELIKQDFYDKSDVYGNKDLVHGANALLNLDKIIKNLNKLPIKFRKFYMKVMIERLNNQITQLNQK